jgi:hypothetical protein
MSENLEIEAIINGDVNGDGRVTVNDFFDLYIAINNNIYDVLKKHESDVNGDYVVDGKDLAAISNHIYGIRSIVQ